MTWKRKRKELSRTVKCVAPRFSHSCWAWKIGPNGKLCLFFLELFFFSLLCECVRVWRGWVRLFELKQGAKKSLVGQVWRGGKGLPPLEILCNFYISFHLLFFFFKEKLCLVKAYEFPYFWKSFQSSQKLGQNICQTVFNYSCEFI